MRAQSSLNTYQERGVQSNSAGSIDVWGQRHGTLKAVLVRPGRFSQSLREDYSRCYKTRAIN